MRIQEIIDRKIVLDRPINHLSPELKEITEPLPPPPGGKADLVFEKTVFNYILNNKQPLGVSNVYQLFAARADGLLKLDTGQMVLLEIKYALGWVKCCQARIQFEWFLRRMAYYKLCVNKPENALIIFHHFSRDWARIGKKNNRQKGWNNFYDEQDNLSYYGSLNIHIAQLTDEKCLVVY
jgi:hypothetical protein